jgi:hypothetical protein
MPRQRKHGNAGAYRARIGWCRGQFSASCSNQCQINVRCMETLVLMDGYVYFGGRYEWLGWQGPTRRPAQWDGADLHDNWIFLLNLTTSGRAGLWLALAADGKRVENIQSRPKPPRLPPTGAQKDVKICRGPCIRIALRQVILKLLTTLTGQFHVPHTPGPSSGRVLVTRAERRCGRPR